VEALVLKDKGELRLEEVADPKKPEEGYALLRVRACGVCGSDIPRIFGGKAYHYPLIPGHEFSAYVHEPGTSGRFSRGDAVAVFPLIPDPAEELTEIGEYALTTHYDYIGSRRDGAFAEWLWAPERNLIPVPPHVDPLHAALTEPAAVALHGVLKLEANAADIGLVIGGGPIGLLVAQWLQISGCRTVVVSEPDPRKRAVAEELGLLALDPAGGLQEQIRSRTAGLDPTCVVEACGLPQTFAQAIEVAAPFGRIVFMGNIAGSFTLTEKQFSSVLRRELRINGTWNSKVTPRGRDEWSTTLAHMDRDLVVGPLISHRIPLSEGPGMLQAMVDGTEWYHKVLFDMDMDDSSSDDSSPTERRS
jgi:L-iditol 2-dehydrogenase/galactitol-1-phosphate 5-dehydrogenase